MTASNRAAEPVFRIRVGERTVAADRHGDLAGTTVIGLHGTPGSRRSALPSDDVLNDLGLHYVTYDRPGYGYSTPARGRTVAHAAADVEALLDHLNIERCVVIGGSGGAPHALACAAALPDRVVSVAIVVPVAPIDLMGADAYFDGIEPGTASLFRLAYTEGAEALEAALTQAISQVGLPEDDESLRQGVVGMVDDAVAIHQAWGFEIRDVGVPVDVWYGIDDENAPAAHALWLAENLPDATPHPQAGDHSWPATRMPEIFSLAAQRARR